MGQQHRNYTEMAQSRQMHRRKKLKEHHDVCEDRYEKAQAMRSAKEREETLILHRRLNETNLQKECSSDSSSHYTVILDHTLDDVADNTGVPDFIRTESVILNKRMLMDDEYTTENSLSSSEFSEDEYVPKPNEDTSDSSSEDGMQHNDRLDEEMPLVREITSPQTEGKSEAKRRKWTEEEIQAVEKTLMDCIRTLKVPGKAQCLNCINTSPIALKGRTWEGVKFYVKNRIDALKRESAKIR